MRYTIDAKGEFQNGPLDGYTPDPTIQKVLFLGSQLVLLTGMTQRVKVTINGHAVSITLNVPKKGDGGDVKHRTPKGGSSG